LSINKLDVFLGGSALGGGFGSVGACGGRGVGSGGLFGIKSFLEASKVFVEASLSSFWTHVL